jgi:hypothetical protein
MEARGATSDGLVSASKRPAWFLGLLPLLLIAVAIGAFVALDGPGLGDRRGPPVEELAVERTVLKPGSIALTVRNDGPDAISVAQAQVNGAYVQFSGADRPIGRLESATVRLSEDWIEGQSYAIALVTSTGGTIEHEIPVAVETPDSGASFFGLMALLGLYVGVIPVALGMLWLPWVRRIPPAWLRAVMGVTVGLLGFLAIDATIEGLELAGGGSQAFGGAALVFVGAAVSYLLLAGVASGWPGAGRRRAPLARRAERSPCSSPSESAFTTLARASRSARPTRPERWPWARSSSSASRSTTPPRASRSSRRSRTCDRRCGASRSSGWSPARPPCLARGSGPRPSTPASRRSCSGSAPGRSCR